jgi:hypothetical protein
MADQDEEFDEAFDQVRKAFQEHVEEFRAQCADMPYSVLSVLCADMSVTMRMMDYIDSVAKPSALGLKRELDGLLRGFEGTVRLAKKGAEEFVTKAKQAMAEAERDQASE